MDVLAQILQERRAAVVRQREQVSATTLQRRAEVRVYRSLTAKLASADRTAVIAEMKKASPSAGLLRPDYDPAALAASYTAAGACGLSVLTEPLHFLGSEEHLQAARAESSLPILRKDFMCDPYQIAEAAAWGADVILLIVAALDDTLMRSLYDCACDAGLEVLAEAHTAGELERALALETAIIGINSRNLKTLVTDLDTARALASEIPSDRFSIAESGIRTRAEILELEARGYDGFLIGEALVRDGDPAGRLRVLVGEGADAG